MRQPRIKGQGQSFYHCVSRVVDGRFLFQTQGPGSVEAEYFVHLMRRLEKACCVQVLTYALMANHFHILCKVPEPRTLSDQDLLDCIELGYGPERRTQVAEQLAAYAKEASLSDKAQQPGRAPNEFPWDRLTGEPLIYASMGTMTNSIANVYRAIVATVNGLLLN